MPAPYGDKSRSSFVQLLGDYRKSARIKGHSFELTEAQFRTLTKQSCYYCGAEPSGRIKHKSGREEYVYSGVDRLDNDKGYVIGNVVACCKRCNYLKSNLSYANFIDTLFEISRHLLKSVKPNPFSKGGQDGPRDTRSTNGARARRRRTS